MSIVALTFDLDDTLWPVKPTLIRAEKATRNWLKSHAPSIIDQFTLEDMLQVRMVLLEEQPDLAHQVSELRRRAMEKMALEAGYSGNSASELAESAFDVFLSHRQQVDCFPGVIELLANLSENYVIGAISNGNADVFKTDLASYFNFSVSAETIGISKPDAAIFAHALEQVNAVSQQQCSASEIIHIGDDYRSDIAGGKDFGNRTIWLASGNRENHDNGKADAMIKDILELPAALAALRR